MLYKAAMASFMLLLPWTSFFHLPTIVSPVFDHVTSVIYLDHYYQLNQMFFYLEDDSVQSNIIDPLIKGALNILKSCLRSKSVKRVVFTSSISTMTALNNDGEWLPVVDESCRIPIDVVWNTKSSGWVNEQINNLQTFLHMETKFLKVMILCRFMYSQSV